MLGGVIILPKRGVIIHDIHTGMTTEVESINEATRWFYKNGISKSIGGALTNVRNSLKDKRPIYKKYYLTFQKN